VGVLLAIPTDNDTLGDAWWAVMGFCITAAAVLNGTVPDEVRVISGLFGGLSGFLAGLFAGVFTFKRILNKRFPGLRIAVIPAETAETQVQPNKETAA